MQQRNRVETPFQDHVIMLGRKDLLATRVFVARLLKSVGFGLAAVPIDSWFNDTFGDSVCDCYPSAVEINDHHYHYHHHYHIPPSSYPLQHRPLQIRVSGHGSLATPPSTSLLIFTVAPLIHTVSKRWPAWRPQTRVARRSPPSMQTRTMVTFRPHFLFQHPPSNL